MRLHKASQPGEGTSEYPMAATYLCNTISALECATVYHVIGDNFLNFLYKFSIMGILLTPKDYGGQCHVATVYANRITRPV